MKYITFFDKSKLKFEELINSASAYLQNFYKVSREKFSLSSPFGQLLSVTIHIGELILAYISHAAEEVSLRSAQNDESIHGLAQLVGHQPYRGNAARGVIQINLNSSANDFITGSSSEAYLRINNKTKFTISENGLTYSFNLPYDYIYLKLNNKKPYTVPIIEGTYESQTFTSDGSALQSFNPVVKNMTDHDLVQVKVNGEEWNRVDSLYDMNEDSKTYICRTGINIGLGIVFGNGSFGMIPPIGSKIDITYLTHNGTIGNLNSKTLTYEFVDQGSDEYGNEVNLNDVLTVVTVKEPNLGSDYEDPEFTRLIAPHTSKSFVLATPENFISYLSRYNQYSFTNAYTTKDDEHIEDDNIVYIEMIPDITKKVTTGDDYFSVDEEEFLLSDREKEHIYQNLEDSGKLLINTEVKIIDPEIKHFVINILIHKFDNVDSIAIKTKIRNILNTYFLNINRSKIVPLSDLIALVEGVEGVDTCNIFYLNQENEEAKTNGYYIKKVRKWDSSRLMYVTEDKIIKLSDGEDPRLNYNELGDLVYDDDILMLPRGGWKDSSGNTYSEEPEDGKLGPLNIFFLSTTDSSSYNLNQQKQFDKIIKEYVANLE